MDASQSQYNITAEYFEVYKCTKYFKSLYSISSAFTRWALFNVNIPYKNILYFPFAAASDDIEGSADGGKHGRSVVSLGWALLTW